MEIGEPEMKEGRKYSEVYVAEGRSFPPQAVQPIRGGMAPTTAPVQVFQIVLRFIQVYAPAYKAILANPRAAVVGLAIV